MADFTVLGGGMDTVYLVEPQNARASVHLRQHVSDEALWLGYALAVEHRFIVDLVAALQDAGFEVDNA